MTILIATKDEKRGKLVLGGDQQLSGGGDIWFTPSKWWIDDGWALGFSGTGEVLEDVQSRVTPSPIWSPYKIIEIWRGYLKDLQVNLSYDKEGWPDLPGEFLFWNKAYSPEIWEMGGAGEARMVTDRRKFAFAGSGSTEARGAINALLDYHPSMKINELVKRAVDTAIKLDDACGGKAIIHELDL